MIADLRTLPIDERIRLVEDIWDSIAADRRATGRNRSAPECLRIGRNPGP